MCASRTNPRTSPFTEAARRRPDSSNLSSALEAVAAPPPLSRRAVSRLPSPA